MQCTHIYKVHVHALVLYLHVLVAQSELVNNIFQDDIAPQITANAHRVHTHMR